MGATILAVLMLLQQTSLRGMAPGATLMLFSCLAIGRADSKWVRFGGIGVGALILFSIWAAGFPNAWVGVCAGAGLIGWLFLKRVRQTQSNESFPSVKMG